MTNNTKYKLMGAVVIGAFFICLATSIELTLDFYRAGTLFQALIYPVVSLFSVSLGLLILISIRVWRRG